MQQRRPRLGDILDDYCPRERRITNHAVVAMIDDEVKQTRCTTCDADHEYKQGKAPAPRRRKPDAGQAADIEGALRPRPAIPDDADEPLDDEHDQAESSEPSEIPLAVEGAGVDAEAAVDPDLDADLDDDDEGNRATDDDGPVHRRLIRATLPRQEGQTPERKPADFTIRQPGGRGGGREFDGNKPGYRPSGGGGAGGGRGRRPIRTHGGAPGQPSRFGGPRQGSGQGQRPPGNRPGGGPPGGNRGGGRPPGQGRGPGGPGGGGGGRKRGR